VATAAERLAAFVAQLRYEEIPEEVIRENALMSLPEEGVADIESAILSLEESEDLTAAVAPLTLTKEEVRI